MSLTADQGPTSYRTKAGDYFIRRIAENDYPVTDWFALTVPPTGRLVYVMEVLCNQTDKMKSTLQARDPGNLGKKAFFAINFGATGENMYVKTLVGDTIVQLGSITDNCLQTQVTNNLYCAELTYEDVLIFKMPQREVVATLVLCKRDERFVTIIVHEELGIPEALFMTYCTKLVYLFFPTVAKSKCRRAYRYILQDIVDNINQITRAPVTPNHLRYRIHDTYAGFNQMRTEPWKRIGSFSKEVYIRKIAGLQRSDNQAGYYILEDRAKQPLLVFHYDKENLMQVKTLLPENLECLFEAENLSGIAQNQPCRVVMAETINPPIVGFINDQYLYDSNECIIGIYDHQMQPTTGNIGRAIMYWDRTTYDKLNSAEMSSSTATGPLSGKLKIYNIKDVRFIAVCYIGLLERVIRHHATDQNVPLIGSHYNELREVLNSL